MLHIYLLYCQGGLSSGYKNSIAEKGAADESYAADSIALFRISGTSIHNNKAIQVEAVCILMFLYLFCFKKIQIVLLYY